MNEDLIAAAQYLDEHGWTRGKYVDPTTGAVCIVGAIRETQDWSNSTVVARYVVELGWAVDRYVRQHYGAVYGSVYNATFFNDSLCKSKEEAVKVLMEAAEA